MRGLARFIVRNKKSDRAFISRIARFLSDNKRMRLLASYNLKEFETMGLDIELDEATLEVLLKSLKRRENKEILEFLFSLTRDDKSRAERLLERIGTCRIAWDECRHPHVIEFIRVLQAAAGRGGQRSCRICRNIPRSIQTYRASGLPEEVKYLRPDIPHGRLVTDFVTKCPECDTFYAYSYDEEFEVVCSTEEIALRRLSPVECLKILSGGKLKHYEETLDQILGNYRNNLSHFEEYMRRESAWALAAYYLDRGDGESIGKELLGNLDVSVRSEALRTLEANISNPSLPYRAGQSEMESAFKAISPWLEKLIEDQNKEVKKTARSLLSLFRG
jgi:hypothetical protein